MKMFKNFPIIYKTARPAGRTEARLQGGLFRAYMSLIINTSPAISAGCISLTINLIRQNILVSHSGFLSADIGYSRSVALYEVVDI